MSIQASILPSDSGLTIQFTATGRDEERIRSMFNIIKDDDDVSKAIEHVFYLALGAIELVEQCQGRLHL